MKNTSDDQQRRLLGNLDASAFAFTPEGLLVPKGSLDPLVKAQMEKDEKKAKVYDNAQAQAMLFSRFLVSNMEANGARAKPYDTPRFETLYQAAKQSFVDATIIRVRIDQFRQFFQPVQDENEPGFMVVHDRHRDPEFKITPDVKKRCEEMEKMLSDPTPADLAPFLPHKVRVHTGLKDLMGRLIRAELVIDRKVMRIYKRTDGKGIAAFHWLPGATIYNVDEAARMWASKNEPNGKVGPHTLYRMSEVSNWDITQAAFVQLVDAQVVAAFTEDEISVHVSNPSDELNRWGYGTSRLEESMDVTATLLYAWQYNKEMFKTNYPEQILTVHGEFDKGGLAAFKQQLAAEAGGPGNYWRLPIVSGLGEPDSAEKFEVKSVKLRESPKDMLFDQFFRFMIMFKCAAYGCHPTILNFQSDTGAGSTMFGRSNAKEIEESKDHGLIPSLKDTAEWFTNILIKPTYDDLKVIVCGIDPEDEKQVVELRNEKTKVYKTRNEARVEDGLEPIGDPKDEKNAWNYPADAPVSSYINTFDMEKQQEAEAAQGGQEGAPGEGGQPGDEQGQPGQDQQDQQDQGDEEQQFMGAMPPRDPYSAQELAQMEQMGKSRGTKFLRITLGD